MSHKPTNRAPRQAVKILLLSDTHLGFDLPTNPRVKRRRRGHDFFANYHRALKPALNGEVDLLVHGGDLFYRSRVPDWLVDKAIEPLIEVANHEVPVFLVPGNHERSRLPLHLWMAHPLMHVFDRPRTYLHQAGGATIALSGFPFYLRARSEFTGLVRKSGWDRHAADAHLLCIHQAIEGTQVGVQNYTFKDGADVVRTSDIPTGIAAVLSGHIHRAQTLRRDLRGHPLSTPVVYPGSIERTSFAERNEDKGYIILEVPLANAQSNEQSQPDPIVSFFPVSSRPMIQLRVPAPGTDIKGWREHLGRHLAALPPDAVVRLEINEMVAGAAEPVLSAQQLRDLAPETMNVSMPRAFGGTERNGGSNA